MYAWKESGIDKGVGEVVRAKASCALRILSIKRDYKKSGVYLSFINSQDIAYRGT